MNEARNLRGAPDGDKIGVIVEANTPVDIVEKGKAPDGTDWSKVDVVDAPGDVLGWVPSDQVNSGNPPPLSIKSKEVFALECWRQAFYFSVNAHYLAAIAELRSGTANDIKGNESGPYRLLQSEWDAVMVGDDFSYKPADITKWRRQCTLFASMLQATETKFRAALKRDPSAAELYLAQLVGAAGAFAAISKPAETLDNILAAVPAAELPVGGLAAAAILDRFVDLLKKDGKPASGQVALDQIIAALKTPIDSTRKTIEDAGNELLEDNSAPGQSLANGATPAAPQPGPDFSTAPTPGAGMDPRIQKLLALIGSVEAPRGYNQMFSESTPQNDLVNLNIAQVVALQTQRLQQGIRSSAAGRYQFLRRTLRAVSAKAPLVGDKFNQVNQDIMAVQLMVGRGLNKYLSNGISREQFANKLAQEWASLPVVGGPRNGRSYYAGDGLNKALVTVDQILAIL